MVEQIGNKIVPVVVVFVRRTNHSTRTRLKNENGVGGGHEKYGENEELHCDNTVLSRGR